MKTLALAVLALLGIVGSSTGALAAEGPYESSTGTVSFAPSNPGPGELVTVTITGCTPGEPLEIALADTTIAATMCSDAPPRGIRRPQQSAAGVATTEITTPTDPGTYRYTVTGSQGYDRTASLVVTAPVVVPDSDEGGSDGISPLMIVMIGAVVIALGVVVQLRRAVPV